MSFLNRSLIAAVLCACSLAVHATDVQVAVSSNFAGPLEKLAPLFEQETGHKIIATVGATGRLYSQVTAGAPLDFYLAADDESPVKLTEDGLAVKGTVFIYAKGRLVLWSPKPGVVDGAGNLIRNGRFEKIAMADPAHSPYGLAALEVLKTMKVAQVSEPKLVKSESVGLAYQAVASGSVPMGFVALSQVMVEGKVAPGSIWMIPGGHYTPIMQAGVILTRGRDNPGAAALMDFLRSEKARAVMRGYGYAF